MRSLRIELDDELHTQLKLAAFSRGTSMSDVIRELITGNPLGTPTITVTPALTQIEVPSPEIIEPPTEKKSEASPDPLFGEKITAKCGHPALRGNKCGTPGCRNSVYA